MSPDQTQLYLLLAALGFCVFIVLLRWATGPSIWDLLWALFIWNRPIYWTPHWLDQSRREKPWVSRAHAALANSRMLPRRLGTLGGWSSRKTGGNPGLKVSVEERSADGSRLSGQILCSRGSIHAECRARTTLQLIEGRLTLVPADEPPMTFEAGDSFEVEPGFSGAWHNETFTRIAFTVTLP